MASARLQALAAINSVRGNYQWSLDYASVAADLFRSLGLETEVLREDWIIALAKAGLGDPRVGIRELKRVRNAFLSNGMVGDAGLVTIDLIETLHESTSRKREAIELANELIAGLIAIDANQSALDGARFLLKVLSSEKVPRSILDHLRQFFQRFALRQDITFSLPS